MKNFDLNKDVIYSISSIKERTYFGAQYSCRAVSYSNYTYPITNNEVNIINYNHWTSGSVSGGYYQTVCAYSYIDTDYLTGSSTFLQNNLTPIYDVTFGVSHSSSLAGYDQQISGNAVLFEQKNKIYRMYANKLLGDKNKNFNLFNTKTKQYEDLNEIIFINIKRNHFRDEIIPSTFSLNILYSGSAQSIKTPIRLIDEKNNIEETPGGRRSLIKFDRIISKSGVTDAITDGDYRIAVQTPQEEYPLNLRNYGYIYYDLGIILLSPHLICSTGSTNEGFTDWYTELNNPESIPGLGLDLSASFSGTYSQFATGLSGAHQFSMAETFSAMRQRIHTIDFMTNIRQRSTFYKCVAKNNEFNYSSNPSFLNSDGEIISNSGSNGSPRTYITRIGMLGPNNELIAVGNLSRPVKKDFETELEIQVRLDY